MVNSIKRTAVMTILLILTTTLPVSAGQSLMMATTTSTDNTGLLEYLKPFFLEATGIELKWVAAGTGEALKLGENCDADVLLVHAPSAEKKYVAAGYGIERREVMYNDFIIIGPGADPAGIKDKSVTEALSAIRKKAATFVSRGDNSGTNKKEILLWRSANLPRPEKESWYLQTGDGMLKTIHTAAERDGYTMTDRGTYIAYEKNMKGNPPLKILVAGDSVLLNQYSVLCVNPERCPSVKIGLARKFSTWIAGKDGQARINAFKLSEKQLFKANAK